MFDQMFGRFWKRRAVGGHGGGSRVVAKNRLQVVLVHDRAGISPRALESFRNDLVGVISRYFEIDQQALSITVRAVDDYHTLLVNTPIIRAKPLRA
ncbi:MAG TPA: cell division topological specificity factor MinE [Thermodesulfobacteriota bacterium]|nr:cell division topological specificity factor MinE [Thermodesulfobacteriota bacterium]